MLIASCFFILGLILLIFAANRLIFGATRIAQHFGVSSLLIGLTVVAFGTSAPEIFISLVASLEGNPAIAIGNAIGSNIANVGLVLGITAIITPIQVEKLVLRREYPLLLIITFIVILMLFNGIFNRFEGLLLLLIFIILTTVSLLQAKEQHKNHKASISNKKKASILSPFFWLILGIILLPIASEIIVKNAVFIAIQLGISELAIGLSIVAIGTSLPELATSIVAILKKEHDISLGNIIGSNILNLILVLPIPALVQPGRINSELLYRDLPALFISTLILFPLTYKRKSLPLISRLTGILFVFLYIVFIFFVLYQ